MSGLRDVKPPYIHKEGFPKSLLTNTTLYWYHLLLSFITFFYSNTYHNWLWVLILTLKITQIYQYTVNFGY